MTHPYTKLADALESYTGDGHGYQVDDAVLREAARILRAAAAVDVAWLMDMLDAVADAQAEYQARPTPEKHQRYKSAREALELALRLALAEREGWQPIETAPEKGPILVVCMTASKPSVAWGCYRATKAYGGTKVGDWYVGPGASMAATHWMPLPAAPKGTP